MRPFLSNVLSSVVDNRRIVTPDSLHASMRAEAYATAKVTQNALSWARPVIQSIDVWLTSCWQEVRYSAEEVPLLLSPAQELVLWREVIEAEGDDLLDAGTTAQLARRAAFTLAEWHIPLNAPEWADNADALRFRDWYTRFKHLCSRRNFATKADLWELAPKWIASGCCSPGETVFLGFHVQSPAFQNLITALGNRAALAQDSPVEQAGAAGVMLCEDIEQEVEWAARRARAVFEQDANRSVAVFVPDLRAHRSLVERTFLRVLHPSSALRFENHPSEATSVFHIAAAGPLEEHPIIASALLLLQLGKRLITIADATALLRCPFIAGAAAERSERAQADLFLRGERELEVSLLQMQRASRNCPQLSRSLEAVGRSIQECSSRQDLPSWSELMADLLQTLGWPGDSPLTSAEDEAWECWKGALSTLGSLGMVSGIMSYGRALGHLRNILGGIGFETGDCSSPIQVLDTRTAAGLQFDHAFAVGLSQEMWPRVPPVSSLIPLQLQRACNVPCSSPQGVQDEQRRVASALFASAPVLKGTYAGRLSAFAEPYVREESFDESPYWPGKLPRESFSTVRLEEVTDGQAPAFRMVEGTRGGTGIIKSQSLCPFRAFSEYRLNAAFPDDACFGFDNLQRGGFLHKALEFVWQEIQTQARLLALADSELRTIVDAAVSQAIELTGGSEFHQQAAEVERKRVGELLRQWLTEVESTRTQPFIVEKIEGEKFFEVDGLRLRLRIDRVDRLPNGKLVLIDYKSGEPTRKSLEGERPSEPQLLIYAAAMGGEVDGLFFGQLKPRNHKAVGWSREPQFPGRASGVLRDKWDGFLEASRDAVERLAREFIEGRAAVNPAKGACEYCRTTPLCRVQEAINSGGAWGEDEIE